VLASLGLKNLQIAPMHHLGDGINAVRVFLPKCWFDAEKCARGIDALKLYRAEVDERRADPSGTPLLKPQPVHDWTSHAADSFRYLALTLDRQAMQGGFYRRIEYASEGVV
jgi:phage terminase large subunit